eukprot:30723-Pelagococcus_subviridis.AAC.4
MMDVCRRGEAWRIAGSADAASNAFDSTRLFVVRDDLRVPSADVEHDGIDRAADDPPHLYVPDAVVHAHDRFSPDLRQHSHDDGDGDERRAHSWPLRVTQDVEIFRRDARLVERRLDEVQDHLSVVLRGLPGEEPRPRRRDVRLPRVAQDRAVGAHDADGHLVRGAFETHRERRRRGFLRVRVRGRRARRGHDATDDVSRRADARVGGRGAAARRPEPWPSSPRRRFCCEILQLAAADFFCCSLAVGTLRDRNVTLHRARGERDDAIARARVDDAEGVDSRKTPRARRRVEPSRRARGVDAAGRPRPARAAREIRGEVDARLVRRRRRRRRRKPRRRRRRRRRERRPRRPRPPRRRADRALRPRVLARGPRRRARGESPFVESSARRRPRDVLRLRLRVVLLPQAPPQEPLHARGVLPGDDVDPDADERAAERSRPARVRRVRETVRAEGVDRAARRRRGERRREAVGEKVLGQRAPDTSRVGSPARGEGVLRRRRVGGARVMADEMRWTIDSRE